MTVKQKIDRVILEGRHHLIREDVTEALDKKISAVTVIKGILYPAVAEIGEKFGNGDLHLPGMLLSLKTFRVAVDQLKPLLGGREEIKKGVIVLGGLDNELKDVGKSLIISLAESQGFKVVEIGGPTDPGSFIKAIKKYKPKIIGSFGLVRALYSKRDIHAEIFNDNKLTNRALFIVFSAPVTLDLKDRLGVEFYFDPSSENTKPFFRIISKVCHKISLENVHEF